MCVCLYTYLHTFIQKYVFLFTKHSRPISSLYLPHSIFFECLILSKESTLFTCVEMLGIKVLRVKNHEWLGAWSGFMNKSPGSLPHRYGYRDFNGVGATGD